ncbi:MAG: tetratricopeptide repeat protein [Pyrinomonadaceae bacterium]
MKEGCENQKTPDKRVVELPVLANGPGQKDSRSASKSRRWRAFALVTLTLLMIAHIIQWRLMGKTISPIEPSESMYTLQQGAINAGFVFFTLAILSTVVFGRWVCGWGCHIVALQDFCAWLLARVGMRPRPFRSRLLIYVPLIAALYMFVWPTVLRFFAKSASEPLIPAFTNHIVTTEFWATFPPVWIAIPFLFICGFVTVYFLGSKGFCTYGCPYGGVFVIADKFAPARIRVTDACNQCGLCTATCTANVNVAAEVKQYGMVVDPGCMKHLDCISVCPTDALYLGFGRPAVGIPSPEVKRNYSLTWPEEIAAALIFLLSYFAVWDVYQIVPMLMALGIAGVTTFLTMRLRHLHRASDLQFYRFSLKIAGRMSVAGWIFAAFAAVWVGWNAHSGFVRYHERAGAIAFESLTIPDELALARIDPSRWLSNSDRKNVLDGVRHFGIASSVGLFTNREAISKLAWLEYLSGDTDDALDLLAKAAKEQDGQARALSLYYRGAILNRVGRYDEALTSLNGALADRSDLIVAHEEEGEALWQIGRRDEAVAAWTDAVTGNRNLPVANNFLAGAAIADGNAESAANFEKQADAVTPPDSRFHFMLGLRLERLGMKRLADKHLALAAARGR